MYEPVRLQQLSLAQAKNLVKGKGVRVKHDPRSPFTVQLSPAQVKKLIKAHKGGKAMTLTLDPYQQEITGQGIFGAKFDKWAKKTFGEKIYHGVEKVGKPLLKKAISVGTKALGAYVSPAVADRLGSMADAYVDDPSAYQSKSGLLRLGKKAITGDGIFGDRADRLVKRFVGQRGMSAIEKAGRPLVTKGIGRVAGMLKSAGVPSGVVDRFENVAEAYVDDPSSYQSRSGLMRLGKRAITGNGIFGDRADRLVKRFVGQRGMTAIEKAGRPLVTKGIGRVAGMLKSAGVPSGVVDRFENVAEAYVDDPSSYQSRSGLMRLGKRAITGSGRGRGRARGGALYPPGVRGARGMGMYPPGVY